MSDEAVLICKRTCDPGDVIEGSVVRQCDDCGGDIWTAPSADVIDPDVMVCIPCAMTRMDLEPAPIMEPTTDQMRELANFEGGPRNRVEFERRFPDGFDYAGEGYYAAWHMDDGRLWSLMPLIGRRLRIVIVEDWSTAGEHWCYSNRLAAMISYAHGPDGHPFGWSRHMHPDGTFEYPA